MMKQDTMTLEKQILERIRSKGVKPTSRGYFKARNYITWGLVAAFVVALSIGVGMIIFMVKGADTSVFNALGLSTPKKIIYSIPFFWIAASIAIAVIAYLNFRNTKKGYRITAKQFGLVTALIALALGSIVYALNITDFVDEVASHNIPLYKAIVPLNTNVWLDPEHGLLSGTIREKDSDERFTLRDSDAELWTISAEDAAVAKGFEFHTGDRVKLIGIKQEDGVFKAIEIRPWEEPKAPDEETDQAK